MHQNKIKINGWVNVRPYFQGTVPSTTNPYIDQQALVGCIAIGSGFDYDDINVADLVRRASVEGLTTHLVYDHLPHLLADPGILFDFGLAAVRDFQLDGFVAALGQLLEYGSIVFDYEKRKGRNRYEMCSLEAENFFDSRDPSLLHDSVDLENGKERHIYRRPERPGFLNAAAKVLAVIDRYELASNISWKPFEKLDPSAQWSTKLFRQYPCLTTFPLFDESLHGTRELRQSSLVPFSEQGAMTLNG